MSKLLSESDEGYKRNQSEMVKSSDNMAAEQQNNFAKQNRMTVQIKSQINPAIIRGLFIQN